MSLQWHGICSILHSIHPDAAIDVYRLESSNALGEQHVMVTQIPLEVEDLHGSAIGAVHLEIGDHATACGPDLCRFPFAPLFGSQSEKLVDAFLRLQGTSRLSFPDIAAEVTVASRLRPLCDPSCSLQMVLSHDAIFFGALRLVCHAQYGKPVVELDVAVPASERYTDSGNAAVDPCIVSKTQHLAQPVASSGAF